MGRGTLIRGISCSHNLIRDISMPTTKKRTITCRATAPRAAAPEAVGNEPTGLANFELAVMLNKRWRGSNIRLTTGFMDTRSAELRKLILSHLNAWSKTCGVRFVESNTDPTIRIARWDGPDWGGYWSYEGRDCEGIPADEPTMNLEGFTARTSLKEFKRVVRHEAGHTLGFPHEHLRQEVVGKIDPRKAYAYFRRVEGWTKRQVDEQVLTPIERRFLFGSRPNPNSIMCYQLPGEITRDGKPILGGTDIAADDYAFAATIYPK
jgi:hypothetical protein